MIARSSTHTHTHTHTIGTVKRKGFTIIQLVIGMLIFAILTGIAFFGISVYTAQANETRVASDLGTFEVAIKDYMLNNPGACSDGTLNPVGLNHYLTKENTLVLDEADPNKDDLGTEISVTAGVKSEAAYKKLSVLEDPWGHQYRVVIRNNADRTAEDGEYGAKGTDRAFIYVYSMGKDGKGAANDTKQDDSVLCVQYSDGEVYSRSYLPSDGKNQAVTAPAYTYWNKDENGKHSVMKDSIFALGGVNPSKAPGKEDSGSGGSDSSGGSGSIGGGGGTSGGSDATDVGNKKIPAGGIYTVKATGDILSGDNGDSFPTPEDGDTYKEGDYTYLFRNRSNSSSARLYNYISSADVRKQVGKLHTSAHRGMASFIGVEREIVGSSSTSQEPVNGWGVLSNEAWSILVEGKSQDSIPRNTSYEEFRGEVGGVSVRYMPGTFAYCTALTRAPKVPNTVVSMSHTFAGCTALEQAPSLPDSVELMNSTFSGCSSLTGPVRLPPHVRGLFLTFGKCASLATAPSIPDSVRDIWGTFAGCTSLVGKTIEVPASAGDPCEDSSAWLPNGPFCSKN